MSNEKYNPKKAWRSINNLLGKQNIHLKVNELKLGQNTLNNPKDITEGFNNYFSNIGSNLASQISTPYCNFYTYVKKTTSEFAAFQPTNVNNVYQLLSGLSSNKATGIDKISCKILKARSYDAACRMSFSLWPMVLTACCYFCLIQLQAKLKM